MIEKTYNVGIYCRLSNDDERDGESVSIENQKLLLQSYVRQRGWNEIAVYCDDGYSGTNFDRPGVKRLIEDAKAKKSTPFWSRIYHALGVTTSSSVSTRTTCFPRWAVGLSR